MRFLSSISKGVILTFGTISLASIMGVGAAGLYFKNDAVKIYTEIRNQFNEENGSESGNSPQGIIKKMETLIYEMLDIGKPDGKFKEHLDSLIIELNGIIDKNVSDLKKLINQQNPIQSPVNNDFKNQIETIIKNLEDSKETIKTSLNDVLKEIDKGIQENIRPTVDEAFKTINNVVASLSSTLKTVTPEKFEEYYGLTATILVAVPATVFGLGILGGIVSAIMYKKVDGKLVSRVNSEEDCAKHISKIIKKYPNVMSKVKK